MEQTQTNTFEWTAFEYIHIERSQNWFWAVGIITFGVVVAAFMVDNTLFAIFAALAGFTSMLFAAKRPEMVTFVLNSKGIQAGHTLYPYNSLKSFWIIEEGIEPKLLLQSKKSLMPQIILPLGNADPEALRAYLKKHIEEEEQDEPIPQKVMERIGF